MTRQKKKFYRQIQEALDDFPKTVAEKKKRYQQRQKFLKETFGDLVRELGRRKRKAR